MNAGIRAARGRYIAIMGAHAHYAPDYLRYSLEVLQETGADNVGGSMMCLGESRLQRAIAAAHHSPFAVGGARWHDTTTKGRRIRCSGALYRREVFDRIGLFDEELVRNQDDEFNLRLTSWWKNLAFAANQKLVLSRARSLQSAFPAVDTVRLLESPCDPEAQNSRLHPASCSGLFCPLVDLSRTSFAMVTCGSLGLDRISRSLSAVQHRCLYSNVVAYGLAAFPCAFCVCLLSFRLWLWIFARFLDFVIFRREPTHAYTKLTRASTMIPCDPQLQVDKSNLLSTNRLRS